MQSVIYCFFAGFLKKIGCLFEYSLLAKVFYAVCSFIQNTVSDSVIGRFFTKEIDSHACFRASVFGKVLSFPVFLAEKISSKVGPFAESITNSSSIIYFIDNWELISIRIYGVGAVAFSLFFTAIRLILNRVTAAALAVGAVTFIIGVIMILINRSLKSIFKGSLVLKSIGGLFSETASGTHSKLFLDDDSISVKGSFSSVIVGLILAVLFCVVPSTVLLLSLGGAAAALMILKYTSFGVFIVAVSSPILPTMLLAGLCGLCVLSLALRLLTDKTYKPVFSPLYGLCGIFALSYFMGTLGSFSFFSSAKIFMLYIMFILFYVTAVNVLKDKKVYTALLTAFVLIGGLCALYGVMQNFLGFVSTDSWVDKNMFENIRIRVYSTFDNPNVLGEYLVLLIPLTLALVARSKKTAHKLIYFAVLCIMAMCLVFTWSRGAWLGAMLAVMIFLVAMDKRWALCALLIIIAIPFAPVILGSHSAVIGRITSIGNTADTSTAYRISIWRSSIGIIKDFWLGGIGPGSDSFSFVYQKYAASGAKFAHHSHNLFLQLAVELGIGGLLAFIALIIKFIKSSVITLARGREKTLYNAVVIAGTSGIIGLLFQGMTDYIWYNYKMLLVFWIVLALTSAANRFSTYGGDKP